LLGEIIVSQIIPCGHIFCEDSFDEWFQSSVRCPVCRYDKRDYRNNTENETRNTNTNTNTTTNTIDYKNEHKYKIQTQISNDYCKPFYTTDVITNELLLTTESEVSNVSTRSLPSTLCLST